MWFYVAFIRETLFWLDSVSLTIFLHCIKVKTFQLFLWSWEKVIKPGSFWVDSIMSLLGIGRRFACALTSRAAVAQQSQRSLATSSKMSGGGGIFVHRDSPENNEDVKFEFTAENKSRADAIMANYPDGHKRAAVIPLLDLAQRQNGGWLPIAAMHHVAEFIGMPRMRVYEVSSSTFSHLQDRKLKSSIVFFRWPHFTQCSSGTPSANTTSRSARRHHVGCEVQTKSSAASRTSWTSRSARLPMTRCSPFRKSSASGPASTRPWFRYATVSHSKPLGFYIFFFQINDDYFEDLTEKDMNEILDELKAGKKPAKGPRSGRYAAEPFGGLTSLTEPPTGPGFGLRKDL